MEVAQFELPTMEIEIQGEPFDEYPVDEKFDSWIQKRTGARRSMWCTPERISHELIYRLEASPSHIADYMNFEEIVLSGMAGNDFYLLADKITEPEGVWMLQVIARGVEAHNRKCPLCEVPLIHPMLGVTYDGRKHHKWKKRLAYNVVAVSMDKNWYYIASRGQHCDLIALSVS